MFALRFLVVIALTFSLGSAAFAADKTTAVWSDGHTSALSDEELIRYAVSSPGPAFPEEAQKAKMTGSGVYELRINKAGATTAVLIVKSSGSAVLDKAATTTFKSWRFKPGTFTSVRIPVSWAVSRVR
jgi:TonB family protein